MDNSQVKNTCSKLNITPIKVFSSPSKSREKQDIFNKIESIITVLIKNHSKWEAAQKRGTSLCTSIDLMKAKAIETVNHSSLTNELNLYPEGLQKYCNKLAIILSICEEIIKTTELFLKQTKGLVVLDSQPKEIFFRTWSLQNFLEFLQNVYDMYQKEIIIKRMITAEIAHCQNRNTLLVYAKAWEYPNHVDEDVALKFHFLRQEIKDLIKLE